VQFRHATADLWLPVRVTDSTLMSSDWPKFCAVVAICAGVKDPPQQIVDTDGSAAGKNLSNIGRGLIDDQISPHYTK